MFGHIMGILRAEFATIGGFLMGTGGIINGLFLRLEMEKEKDGNHIIQKSSIPESSSIDKSEFEFDFNYKKLDGEYHLIDVIAVVQKINVEKKDDLPI